ncbi:hypothetical protein ASPCADRAFT_212251, partial [Aspergillus carbonarius ITEM 5010]
ANECCSVRAVIQIQQHTRPDRNSSTRPERNVWPAKPARRMDGFAEDCKWRRIPGY